MLSLLRHLFIDSWVGRIFVGLIMLVFVGLGVESVFTNMFQKDANIVAWTGGKEVSVTELDSAVRKDLPNFVKQQGFSSINDIPEFLRSAEVSNVLQQLITQNLLIEQARHFGFLVPDEVVKNVVFATPSFQVNGRFDRDTLSSILNQNHLSESAYLDMIRNEMAIESIMYPLQISAAAPDVLVKPFFEFQGQARTVSYVEVLFNQFKPQIDISEAALKRYYDNHPWEFRIPEFRRVRVIILSPETIAKDLEVSDQDAQRYYNSEKDKFNISESRTVQVVTVQSQQDAQAIAAAWKANNSWSNIQSIVKKSKGLAIEMPNLRQTAIPVPALATAVFKAALNTVSAPLKTPTGFIVFKVTAIMPAQYTSFDAAKPQLKKEIATLQAGQVLAERVRQVQDTLAGGEGLDGKLGGLGVAAIEGTINEQGLTQEGDPAPIPAQGKFRQDMLTKIFSTAQGAQPSLIQGSDTSYYAFIVESIIPAHEEDYAQASQKVLQAYRNADIRRQANIAATTIFRESTVSKNGVIGLKSHFPVKVSAAFSRINPSKDLPAVLQNKSFMMSVGQSEMVQSPNGFIVATLTGVSTPKKSDQPANYQQLKGILMQSMGNDIQESYMISMRDKQKTEINQQSLDRIINQVFH